MIQLTGHVVDAKVERRQSVLDRNQVVQDFAASVGLKGENVGDVITLTFSDGRIVTIKPLSWGALDDALVLEETR